MDKSKKTSVAVLFGGMSSEHDISKISAKTIISAIDKNKFNIVPVYITKDGNWLLYDGATDNINTDNFEKYGATAIISPSRNQKGLLRIVQDKVKIIPIDVVIPVIHGRTGEDGKLQGLFELAGIPYVGCNLISSAMSLDKVYTKIVTEYSGILGATFLYFNKKDMENPSDVTKKIRDKIGYPCFVKPSNAGSSVGVSKAKNGKELTKALSFAFEHDEKVLVEKALNGRELECGVLDVKIEVGENVKIETRTSVVGEVLAASEFYDYDAKYNNNESKTVVPANIPEDVSLKIREFAVTIYKSLECEGLSRVDFIWDEENNEIYFNEINTMPGFTSISMYPMLFAECNMGIEELVTTLIQRAMYKKED